MILFTLCLLLVLQLFIGVWMAVTYPITLVCCMLLMILTIRFNHNAKQLTKVGNENGSKTMNNKKLTVFQ